MSTTIHVLSKTILAFVVLPCLSCHSSGNRDYLAWQYSEAPPPAKFADFYRPLRHGLDELPQLIKQLDDVTPSENLGYMVPGTNTVADEALWAIGELIGELPFMAFVDEPYRSRYSEIGVYAYYGFVQADRKNRKAFQERVRKWVHSADEEQRKKWGQKKWFPVPGY